MAGLGIIKYGSAASRESVGFMRSVVVWFFLIFVPINSVYLQQFFFVGFFYYLLLEFGVLVFNEILVLPCFRHR
jgi:hypothetical protein